MTKKDVLWRLLESIFLILFNVIFFLLGGFEHPASVWISYGFIHFAYVMLLLTPLFIRKSKSMAILGATIYSISATYFLIALVTGVIFILIAQDGINATLITQLSIAGLYAIILISHLIANERTADTEEKRQREIAYVKEASSHLKRLVDRVSDKDIKRKVERVYDAVNSSPVKSHYELSDIENRILQLIDELATEISAQNNEKVASLSNTLLEEIANRNSMQRTFN